MTYGISEGLSPDPDDASQLIDERGMIRHSRKNQKRRLRRISMALIILLLLGVTAAGWLVFRADQIRSSLTSSSALSEQLRVALAEGNPDGARFIFANLKENTARARAAATDPLWRAAGNLPLLGSNFSAVSEVAVSADDVINRALGPVIEHYETMDFESFAPVDGRIDLAPIEDLSPRLLTASNTVRLSYDRLSGIDSSALLPQVSGPLEEVKSVLREANGALEGASAAARLAPDMLGANGQRDYLLLVQNNAEVRATGGITGALAVVSASKGRIELTAQSSASGLGRFSPPIVVDPDQIPIFSTRMGSFMQSVNLTPDFPTAAQTAAKMWEFRNDEVSVEGVISLDPVALSYILGATGPVELSFNDRNVNALVTSAGLPTSLTAQNVVPTLLSDVYAAIEEPALQDAYFAAVASEVFGVLSSGTGTGSGLIQSLVKSSDEGRLFLWSKQVEEQDILVSTGLAGSVTGAASGGAAFGAYFNDGTGAKMDYYMRRTVQLQRSCTPEGYLQYTLTATLTNTAPTDAGQSLPAYVTGGGAFGVPPGTVQTNVVGYGPDQSLLQTARINGETVPLGSYRHGDRPVGILTTNLAPGQSARVELDFTKVVQKSVPVLDVTPTIEPTSKVVLPLQGDDSCV